MKSIREVFKIGRGPSSSHTMGPEKAVKLFKSEHPDAASYKVILYGSLAETGKGHCTDRAVIEGFEPSPCEIVWNTDHKLKLPHENTMDIFAYDKDGNETARERVMSVGGGDIVIEGRKKDASEDIYTESTFNEIAEYCLNRNIRLSDYVFEHEGDGIRDYLSKV